MVSEEPKGPFTADQRIPVKASARTPAYQLCPDAIDAMYRHARECFPRECCGFLQRKDNEYAELVVCENVQDKLHALDPEIHPRTAETAYSLGGAQLLSLVRSFDSSEPALMIYHSHPRGGAYFSEMDRKAALAVDYPVDYLVIDVGESSVECARLFRRETDGDQFFELLRIEGKEL